MAKMNRVRIVVILVTTALSFMVPMISLLASANFSPTLMATQIASPLGSGKNPLGGWTGKNPLAIGPHTWGMWGHTPLATGQHTWGIWGHNPLAIGHHTWGIWGKNPLVPGNPFQGLSTGRNPSGGWGGHP